MAELLPTQRKEPSGKHFQEHSPQIMNHFWISNSSITTQIIHRQNAMLKSTKQRVLTNLNDIDAVIEMETPDTEFF
jgi:hypothetical protein